MKFSDLYQWVAKMQCDNREPAFVPLSRDEIVSIYSSADAYVKADPRPTRDRVMGIDVFTTPFAEEMRQRQVEMSMIQLAESVEIDTTAFRMESHQNHITGNMIRRLSARICCDTTKIMVTMEWDSIAWLKRKTGLSKWWKVKQRTVEIEGRVLYPYLKLSLPANRHHVTFAL